MHPKLTRFLLLLTLLLCSAIGVAQAEIPTEKCPSFSASDLRRNASDRAQALQAEAQKLNPKLTELELPKLSMPELSQIGKVAESVGEQVNRAKGLEWREGAKALASDATSSAAKGWETLRDSATKRVAPQSVNCLQQWTNQALTMDKPNLTEKVQEDVPRGPQETAPEQLEPAPLPGVEMGTEMLDNVRRAAVKRMVQQNTVQEVGSSALDTLANAFPTAFRIIKYYVIWVISTSILVTVLLLVVLVRLGYILLFAPKRSENVK